MGPTFIYKLEVNEPRTRTRTQIKPLCDSSLCSPPPPSPSAVPVPGQRQQRTPQVRGLGGGAVRESHRRPNRWSFFPAGAGNCGLSLVCPGSGSLPSHGEKLDPRRRAAGAGQQSEPETQICLPAVRPGPRREDLQNRAAAGAEGDAGAAGDGGAAAEHRGARHPGGRPGPGRRHLLRRVQEVAGESGHRSQDERSLPGVKPL